MIETPQLDSVNQAPLQQSSWLTRQHVLVLLLSLLTLAALVVCFLMLRPFLASLSWALALAIVSHPLHEWIKARVPNDTIAALIAVSLVTIILVVPAVFVIHQLLQEAVVNFDFLNSRAEMDRWRGFLEESVIGDVIVWLQSHFDLVGEMNRFFAGLASSITDIVRESVWTLVQFLVTIFTLFFLFRDRQKAVDTVRSLVPLSYFETDEVFRLVEDTIHATLYGSVTMGAIQGTLGGLMFWWLGLPAPVLWGVVMAVLATVPNLGAFVVWAPAAVGLAFQEEWAKAGILTAWGLIAIGLIDNMLYPFMVGQRIHMHSLPVFFSILGGLYLFGAAGLILGPVVFALTHALLEIWRRRTAAGRAAENGTPPSPRALLEEEGMS
jgi:predicted PurR-regulated permease PerM